MSKKHSQVTILDSSLRDGVQAESINFSVQDKISIVKLLDKLGVEYIEAGNPSSNPKDAEFFREIQKVKLSTSKLVAFGSTRLKGISCENDINLKNLVESGTDTVSIFGKSWDFQVTEVLKTSLQENLSMIYETCLFLKKHGKTIIFDAEHFFDGYASNPDYALRTLKSAIEGGAEIITLCDTNGGTMPMEILKATTYITSEFQNLENVQFGIHTHNDGGLAVANSLMALEGGCTHIQGTLLGFGERTGNANLSTIIPSLELKLGVSCLPKGRLHLLTPICREIAEISNMIFPDFMPYVGTNSFAHKAGMHIDAVKKNPIAYEHIDPDKIGNERVFLLSEVSGRAMILDKINRIDPSIKKDDAILNEIMKQMKNLEKDGYSFEGAEGSFDIFARKIIGKYKSFFKLHYYKLMSERPNIDENVSTVVQLKIEVDGKVALTVGEGRGPIHALDTALRNALRQFFPIVNEIRLTDYKVRVIDSFTSSINATSPTAAVVRVLIESTDGSDVWTTVGVSQDIIEASWKALVDSFEYKLSRLK